MKAKAYISPLLGGPSTVVGQIGVLCWFEPTLVPYCDVKIALDLPWQVTCVVLVFRTCTLVLLAIGRACEALAREVVQLLIAVQGFFSGSCFKKSVSTESHEV